MYGKSFGPNPQKFILGGLQNWIWGSGETFGEQDESRFRSQPIDTSNASMLIDVYLSDFMFPMRGYRFWERTGSNTLLMNFEFRFPFLFAFGIPNKFVFSNFGSYLFFDISKPISNNNHIGIARKSCEKTSGGVRNIAITKNKITM